MENSRYLGFNKGLRDRTQAMASCIYEILNGKRSSRINHVPVQQLLRSSAAVATAYRSAVRGRSDAEYYAKICVVVEECDETLFWLDFLVGIKVLAYEEVEEIRVEVTQLLRIFTSIKIRVRNR